MGFCGRGVFALLIFICMSANSFAEEALHQISPNERATPAREISFWSARGNEFLSPWTTQARPWLIYGSMLTLTLTILEDQIDDPLQNDTVDDRPIGKYSKLGDLGGQGLVNALYSIGMGTHYLFTKRASSAQHFSAMTKASAYAIGVSSVLKYMVHEPRPSNTAGSRSYASFPSGHATAAFSFSSAVIAEHGFWPWGFGATALAILTGFSRINDNAHYLHDVVGGFTIGTAYGFGISYLQRGRLHHGHRLVGAVEKTPEWFVAPAFSEDFKGVIAHYQF